MADIRINALATTAASTASDDFVAVDGSANGTRKLNAFSPTFGGNLTVSGSAASTIEGTLGLNCTPVTWYDNANLGTALQIGAGAGIYAFNTTGNTQLRLYNNAYLDNGGAEKYLTTGEAFVFEALGGEFRWKYASSGTAGNAVTLGRVMSLLGNGNLIVGSGSVDGGQKLQVAGSAKFNFATNTNITLSGSGTISTISSLNDAGNAYQPLFVSGSVLTFNIGGSESARFAATSGNLLLGTTTDSGNGKLQLATHTTSAGGIGFGSDASLYRYQAGGLALDATNNVPALMLRQSGTNALFAYTSSLIGYIGTPGAYSLNLQTNNTTALTLDASQNATFAGKITANGAGSTFKGTATNDSAAAGYMGEYAETSTAYGSRITLTTDTVANVASVSLTAGDWDVSGNVELEMSGVTSTDKRSGVSTTSASLTNNPDTCGVIDLPTTTLTGYLTIPTPTVRISIASTTTVYLPTKVTFSAGTTKAWGIIRARRVR